MINVFSLEAVVCVIIYNRTLYVMLTLHEDKMAVLAESRV